MRRGFTLMELLIVITIIMVLMGLIFPAVNMVRKQANTVKCSNNLRQIALALEVYRQNHDDGFPGKLSELLPDGFDPKCFICPFDKQHGADPYMGRSPSWGPDYNKLKRETTSYCYETSGEVDPTGVLFDAGDIAYFYRDLDAPQRPAAGTKSWAEGKLHQQKFGNLKPGKTAATGFADWGAPFPPDDMPIVRCYWHAAWPPGGGDMNMPRKVNNISLGFNTFWSIPFWEIQINPFIPHN